MLVATFVLSLYLSCCSVRAAQEETVDVVSLNKTSDSAVVISWQDAVVNGHNVQRAAFDAGPLTWSDALYHETYLWARQCQFRHSSAGGEYGENLAWNSAPGYGLEAGIQDWMNEYPLYDFNNPHYSPSTGHFTQIVWKDTREVACSIANCGAGTIYQFPSRFLVCRYAPEGNFIGRFAENVGRPNF